MEPDWNELTGELRSALAARNWGEAGAVVWRLRQLDQERYTLELEHYTNQQVGKGGRGVALETEQRLEAVRSMARTSLDFFSGYGELQGAWQATLERLSKSDSIAIAVDGFNRSIDIHPAEVMYEELNYYGFLMSENGVVGYDGSSRAGKLVISLTCCDFGPDGVLRPDMRDVLWSILEEFARR